MKNSFSEIKFIEIIRKSWEITRSDRLLWFFGFLLALSGVGVNFLLDSVGSRKELGGVTHTAQYLGSDLNQWLILVFLVAGLVIFILVGIVGRIGIIVSAKREKNIREKKHWIQIQKIFSEVRKNIKEIVFFELGLIVFCVIILLLLLSPVSYLSLVGSKLASAVGVLGFLVMFYVVSVTYFVWRYFYFYFLLTKIGLRESVNAAYDLLRKNVSVSLIFFLVIVFCELVIFIALAQLVQLLDLLRFNFSYLFEYMLILPVYSVYFSFQNVAWMIFFEKIAKQKEGDIANSVAENGRDNKLEVRNMQQEEGL